MRSRVAMATAVSRGFTVVAGVLVLVGVQVLIGTGAANASTRVDTALVAGDGMDVGLAGTVGVVAVLVGAVGLVYGFTRRHRLARKTDRPAAGPISRS
jgi:hypothetical protein